MAFHTVSPIFSTVGVFDASSHSYGVAYKPTCPEGILLELSARIERHGCWSAFSFDRDLPTEARLRDRLDPSFAAATAAWLHHDWASVCCDWKVARFPHIISRWVKLALVLCCCIGSLVVHRTPW